VILDKGELKMTDSEDVKNIKKYIDDRIWKTEQRITGEFRELHKSNNNYNKIIVILLVTILLFLLRYIKY